MDKCGQSGLYWTNALAGWKKGIDLPPKHKSECVGRGMLVICSKKDFYPLSPFALVFWIFISLGDKIFLEDRLICLRKNIHSSICSQGALISLWHALYSLELIHMATVDKDINEVSDKISKVKQIV